MKTSHVFVLLVSTGFFLSAAAEDCSQMMFSSELEAVKAAADFYNPLSIRDDREYMGTIFKHDTEYGYTVSQGKKGSDRISISVPTDSWDHVTSFWHTHGDESSDHRYFSDVDTTMVKRYGKPFYLADYTGYLKVFKYGDKTLSKFAAARLGLASERDFAIGEFVRDNSRQLVRIETREIL